jgi:acyl-CoA thioesterase YciA
MDEKKEITLRIHMSPQDINYLGVIFGGVILSHIDLAGAAAAKRYSNKTVVTVSMREVQFLSPVYVGDLVSFCTTIIKVGRTSITIKIEVEAERIADAYQTKVKVTEAEVVYVAVDQNRKPIPIESGKEK